MVSAVFASIGAYMFPFHVHVPLLYAHGGTCAAGEREHLNVSWEEKKSMSVSKMLWLSPGLSAFVL